MILFELGRSKLIEKVIRGNKASKVYSKIERFVSKVSKESIFLTVFYSKLVYGSRTATVIYLGSRKSDTKNF